MEPLQGTINESSGVAMITHTRKLDFHRITKEEIDNLMSTSMEFQFFTALFTFSFGASISAYLSGLINTVSIVIFFCFLILGLIFLVVAIYFYFKMKKEKETYFQKISTDNINLNNITVEDLQKMINDLLSQIADLEGRRS